MTMPDSTLSFIEDFLKQMDSLSLRHEAPWVLDEMKSLTLTLKEQEAYLLNVLERRKMGEPLAYIFGHWAFRDLELCVGAGVLIPRPETEELVDLVFEKLKFRWKQFPILKIVDAGAGSGCLGLGFLDLLLKEEGLSQSRLELLLIEQSQEAVPYLKTNVENFSSARLPGDRFQVDILSGSWSSWTPNTPIQVLLSNPPYISGSLQDDADQEVKTFEPHEALYPADLNLHQDASGPYRELIKIAQQTVVSGGVVAFELGASQASWIASFVEENYPDWRGELIKDMSRKDRFWIMERIR